MHPQYQKALRLRLKGKSYNEIARTLSVSKGSLSVWFRDLKLTKSAKKLLEKKMRIAREHGLFENNRQRTRAIWIENQRIKVCVRIYANISEQSAVNFWAGVTNIPKSHFRIFRQISKASNRKRPINSLPYGTLDLRVHGRKIAFQVKGWIGALKLQSGLK